MPGSLYPHPAGCLEMDFFEQFSGLSELQSAEAKRRRLWLCGAAVLVILATIATLYQLGYV